MSVAGRRIHFGQGPKAGAGETDDVPNRPLALEQGHPVRTQLGQVTLDLVQVHQLRQEGVHGQLNRLRPCTGTGRADRLAQLPLRRRAPKERLQKFKKVGEHTFRRIRDDDESLGETLFFEVDEDGSVTRLLHHSNWETKVE